MTERWEELLVVVQFEPCEINFDNNNFFLKTLQVFAINIILQI